VLAGTLAPAAAAAPRGCDPVDRAHCLLPWPTDHFRKGGRLALRDAMMPRNRAGRPVRAADYNRSDGFSPGQIVVTRVPRLDLRRSGAVPVTDMARSFARDAPIVVIDARSGRRQLIWAEPDSQATRPSERALLVHPGANWREGRRYIVALRDLKDARGRTLQPGRAFRRFPRRQGERAGTALRVDLPHPREGGDPAPRPLPRLGLHRGEPPVARGADALRPRPRLRGARRRGPR
jgi:hypothetical protein